MLPLQPPVGVTTGSARCPPAGQRRRDFRCLPLASALHSREVPASRVPTPYVQLEYALDVEIRFEWDERKNASNQRKHGVAFEEAALAFWDEHAIVMADPDHDEVEDRFVLLGHSGSRELVVAHCYRHGVIRIISARRANRHERAAYLRGLN